jgi:hypothetical protein
LESELIHRIISTVLYTTAPGAAGGLVSFLLALKRGHYRNNKYLAKFSIEVIGAMVTASFLSALITSHSYQPTVAFLIGIGWTGIIQLARAKITKIVEVALGEKIDGR